MIPPFLAEFKDAPEAHKLQTVKIKATPVSEGETLLLTQSKFLGKPYLPVGSDYPKDAKGAPPTMEAEAQTDFSFLTEELYAESPVFRKAPKH